MAGKRPDTGKINFWQLYALTFGLLPHPKATVGQLRAAVETRLILSGEDPDDYAKGGKLNLMQIYKYILSAYQQGDKFPAELLRSARLDFNHPDSLFKGEPCLLLEDLPEPMTEAERIQDLTKKFITSPFQGYTARDLTGAIMTGRRTL